MEVVPQRHLGYGSRFIESLALDCLSVDAQIFLYVVVSTSEASFVRASVKIHEKTERKVPIYAKEAVHDHWVHNNLEFSQHTARHVISNIVTVLSLVGKKNSDGLTHERNYGGIMVQFTPEVVDDLELVREACSAMLELTELDEPRES